MDGKHNPTDLVLLKESDTLVVPAGCPLLLFRRMASTRFTTMLKIDAGEGWRVTSRRANNRVSLVLMGPETLTDLADAG